MNEGIRQWGVRLRRLLDEMPDGCAVLVTSGGVFGVVEFDPRSDSLVGAVAQFFPGEHRVIIQEDEAIEHVVDLGCARVTHAGIEASCLLCHPATRSA